MSSLIDSGGRASVHRASLLFRTVTLFLALASQSGCSRFDLLNAMVPSGGYVITRDVAYGALPRQTLDVYRPRGATSLAPVVIFFYGGDWQTGSKRDYRFVAQALASRGFVAVMPDYRLYPEAVFPAFVEDGALAVRWARNHAALIGGDGRRIHLMGHSAGAHIAALLTLDEHYLRDVGLDRTVIRGTAALSGPYEFTIGRRHRAVFGLAEGETEPEAASQPIRFVDGRAPPMLLVHGLDDTTVRAANAARLAGRIRGAGGDVRTVFYEGEGHVSVVLALAWPFRWVAPTLSDVVEFFRSIEGDAGQ